MKYVIFVEGHTEEDNLPDFIGRWFNIQKLSQTIRIEVVRFAGCTDFYHKAIARAQDHLNAPDSDEIIGVIGLLDLYGPRFYPEDKNSIREREVVAKCPVDYLNSCRIIREAVIVLIIRSFKIFNSSCWRKRIYSG